MIQVIKSRMIECRTMGEGTGVYKVSVGNPEGKRPFGRPRCRMEDNIKMYFQQLGCGDLD